MENIIISINSRVKELMKDKSISHTQLAKDLGIEQSNLRRMLNNDDLKITLIVKIAKVLNVPMSTFFEEMDKDLPPAPQKLDAIYEKINELLTIAKQSEVAVFAR